MPFFAYILRCRDNTLYCGSTPDLKKRLHEHNHLKTGAKYTRGRRPVELAHFEEFETLSEARKRENAIKKLSRPVKEALCLTKKA
jgi:putative endonuclease